MFRRLCLGLFEGLLIGAASGLACSRGLGWATLGALFAVAFGAAAGFVVGLVAGRPIWARDAKTEALLKAGAGALLGAGLAFATQRWLAWPLDLSGFGLGAGPAGELPMVALPAVATVLALFFELDDTSAPRAVSQHQKIRVPGNTALGSAQESDLDLAAELRELDALDEANDVPAAPTRKVGKR